MRNFIFLLLFLLLFTALHSVSYSGQGAPFLYGSNDSLLFDGAGEYTEIPYSPADDGCQTVVVYTRCAYGDIYVTRTGNTCGEKDTITIVKKNQLLKKGDVLVPGSILKVCVPESYDEKQSTYTMIGNQFKKGGQTVEFDLEFAPNSETVVPDLSPVCKGFLKGENITFTVEHKRGRLFYMSHKIEELGNMAIKSINSIVDHINTKFSVEIKAEGTDTIDIIRVYEGTATVKLAKSPPSNKNSAKDEIDKLQKDFKDGKITAQEYKEKLRELSQNLTKNAMDIVPVEVTAGNKCTATNHSLTVEPIESNDDIWWEDIGN